MMRRSLLLASVLLSGCSAKPEEKQAAPRADSLSPAGRSAATPAPDVTVLDSVVYTPQLPGLGVTVYSSDTLRSIANEISKGASTADVFLKRPGLQVVEARRVSDGTPEVHDDWADAAVVQSGHATLLSGGTVHGAQLRSPGEWRGGTISGGVQRKLAAGDFLIVPPGVPHQYLVARGDSIRYLTVKVPRVVRMH